MEAFSQSVVDVLHLMPLLMVLSQALVVQAWFCGHLQL
jgi:hypothetical protein